MEVYIKWSLSTSSLSSLINTHQQQNAGRCVCVCMHAVYYSLEEVVSAVEFALSWEALLVQRTLALGTLHTLNVPGLVQYFHKVSLHDRLVTASAHKWSDHLALSLLSSFAWSLFYVNARAAKPRPPSMDIEYPEGSGTPFFSDRAGFLKFSNFKFRMRFVTLKCKTVQVPTGTWAFWRRTARNPWPLTPSVCRQGKHNVWLSQASENSCLWVSFEISINVQVG